MSTAEERMQDEIDELEQENRLLRARNDRLEAEAKVVSVQEPVALDVTLDGEEAKLLRDMLGDDRHELSPVRLLVGNGHSGHGLYAAHAEYQEEGAVLLAATPPAAQQPWVELTDKQIESIFLDAGWSWGEKADMYVPAVREILKLFKEINE